MRRIVDVEILQVDLPPKVPRSDAIQSFVTQETPIVRLTTDDGARGTGYSYTIGTGGSSVVALLADHLAPRLLGRDADEIEPIRKDLFFRTHATAVGAITSIALAWFEEPLPAEDLGGHVRLARSTSLPIAVGESMYALQHFREYLQREACSIVQVDVGRIGGITPWLKVAYLAESFNVAVCPHFLMELHVSLTAAVPAARWVEYIPQLDGVTRTGLRIEEGYAHAPEAPGNGIDWDWMAIDARAVARRRVRAPGRVSAGRAGAAPVARRLLDTPLARSLSSRSPRRRCADPSRPSGCRCTGRS